MKMNTIAKVRVDERLLQEIKEEVKETVALHVQLTPGRTAAFCAADLWNIHRQKKQRSVRRFL